MCWVRRIAPPRCPRTSSGERIVVSQDQNLFGGEVAAAVVFFGETVLFTICGTGVRIDTGVLAGGDRGVGTEYAARIWLLGKTQIAGHDIVAIACGLAPVGFETV